MDEQVMAEGTTGERIIHHLGLLDLRNVQAPEELKGITRINHVGSIVTVPADLKLKLLTGDLKLAGDFLENGNPEETLLVTGELTITSAFGKVGFRSIILTGEIFAPQGCESVLTAAVSELAGELFFYAGEPRMYRGRDRFDAAFFSYLKRPVSLFLRGEFTVEADVTPELLQEKVTELYLWGELIASERKTASCLLALAAVKYGDIRVAQS